MQSVGSNTVSLHIGYQRTRRYIVIHEVLQRHLVLSTPVSLQLVQLVFPRRSLQVYLAEFLQTVSALLFVDTCKVLQHCVVRHMSIDAYEVLKSTAVELAVVPNVVNI